MSFISNDINDIQNDEDDDTEVVFIIEIAQRKIMIIIAGVIKLLCVGSLVGYKN